MGRKAANPTLDALDDRRPGDCGDRNDRARTPTSGIRQRLRQHLRTLGIRGKFRTDELRDGSLVIIAPSDTCAEVAKVKPSCGWTFEGRFVQNRERSANGDYWWAG